jgi:alcohol dehydrogenase (cytochrome c)
MTTKGGLVFWGTPEGFLKAADAKTGKEVWSFQVGTGIVAPPITWEQDGEQYIAVAPAGVARFRCGVATWPRR